jgi:hypothetical protein
MPQQTTAGRLLAHLHRESVALRDTIVGAAGVSLDDADAAMTSTARLSLAEQFRLAEATIAAAPQHGRLARTLRAQVLAARSFNSGEVVCSRESPRARWECVGRLAR